MPGPGNQNKSSKRKTATANTAVASSTNGNISTASESTTPYDFRTFLEMADRKCIAQFCNIAASTREGENLRLLWIRALDEGEKLGIKQGRKLGIEEGRKLGTADGLERGMDLGREEGYLIAKEGFDRIIQGVKAKETPEKPNTHETATQTNDELQQQSTAMQTTPVSTADAVTQTATYDEPPRPLRDVGTSMDTIPQPST